MNQPITQQPGLAPPATDFQMTVNPLMPRGVPRAWSSGLLQCFDDIPSCLIGFFFHPCHQCCIASDMGESCCVPMCLPGPLISMRALHRGRHNVQGSLLNDCCTSIFCGWCAGCQLAREVQGIKSGRIQA
ncbi:cornifelin-like [Lytechinus variegatus]|uniref:cornifelin-like n=1 Tax=Lytechinus variegatus TaxID=7654 RepID=UPI001BB0D89D|nr:cornifelin-like [Lytechinus variegatus]